MGKGLVAVIINLLQQSDHQIALTRSFVHLRLYSEIERAHSGWLLPVAPLEEWG